MRSDKWQEIEAARELLQLRDEASQIDIKNSYRRLSKKYHPDLHSAKSGGEEPAMEELNAAYKILIDYCSNYRIPLTFTEDSKPLDDEDWWLSRFGEDPLWSKT